MFIHRGITESLIVMVLVPIVACAAADEPWETLDRESEVAALELISLKIKSNHSRLGTWTGKYRVEEELLLAGPTAEHFARQLEPERDPDGVKYLKVETAYCEFAIDFASDSIFTSLEAEEPPKLFDTYSGGQIETQFWRTYQKSVLTPDQFLTFQPDRVHPQFEGFPTVRFPNGAKRGRAAFSSLPSVEDSIYFTKLVIDPRTFLFDFPSRDTCGQFAKVLASDNSADQKAVRERGVAVTQQSDEGRLSFKLTYHAPIANGVDYAVERTFAEDADFSLVDESVFRLPERTLVQQEQYQYKTVSGLPIPSTYRKRLTMPDGLTTTFDRTCTLVDSRVNLDIPQETFTVSALGLLPGDRLVDNVAGELFVQTEQKLLMAGEVREQPVTRWWRIVAWTSPSVLLAWAIVVWRRRAGRRPGRAIAICDRDSGGSRLSGTTA